MVLPEIIDIFWSPWGSKFFWEAKPIIWSFEIIIFFHYFFIKIKGKTNWINLIMQYIFIHIYIYNFTYFCCHFIDFTHVVPRVAISSICCLRVDSEERRAHLKGAFKQSVCLSASLEIFAILREFKVFKDRTLFGRKWASNANIVFK